MTGRMLDDAGKEFSDLASASYIWGVVRMGESMEPGKLVNYPGCPIRWYKTRANAVGFARRNIPVRRWAIARYYP